MLILHGAWHAGRLYLWGERPRPDGAAKPPARARGEALPNPYDAGALTLAEAMQRLGWTPLPAPAPMTAWLPTARGVPLPSSPLIAPGGAPAKARTRIAPWTVTAFAYDAARALELLCRACGPDLLQPGILAGPGLRYWTAAMRLAGALTADERVLPSVAEQDGEYRAVWTPIAVGADAGRAALLAARMPGAARALAAPGAKAPETAPAAALAAFLEAMTDAMVREGQGRPAPVSAARLGRRAARKKPAPRHDSLHAQWLDALRGPETALEGEARDLAAFAAQVHAWMQPLTEAAAAPFRLCFRLEEPQDDEPLWRTTYLLQAQDDPSLQVPLDEAWHARGDAAAQFKRRGVDPRAFALRALGRAAVLCPPVDDTLRGAAPTGFDLDTAGAHRFLTAQAPALEAAGFGVLLPAWWTRRGARQRLALRASVSAPKIKAEGKFSLESLVTVDWTVALGGDAIAPEELEDLARMKSALVRVRGQWVEVNAEEIGKAIDFLRGKAGAVTLRDAMQIAVGADDEAAPLPVTEVRGVGWAGDLLARLQGARADDELDPPETFLGTLRPYQRRGLAWLDFMRQWGLGACLADDMGLGKTVQTLALVQRAWEQGQQRPVLLVCPTSVIGNWQKEAARFTPGLPVMVHHGADRAKTASFVKAARKHALVISSYALMHRDREPLAEVDWAGIVADEAQNIKNSETKQAKAVRAIRAEYRIALTGTPVENHIGDLWSLMEFLNPGLLGKPAAFRRRFFVPIQARQDAAAAARLRRITGPFVLRRLKTDKTIVADLPDKLEMKVFCTLTREQASLYAAVLRVLDEGIAEAEGIERRGLVLATLVKLKQVCNHPAQFLGDSSALDARSGKLARLTEMLEEAIAAGDRALVFTQFAGMGQLLQHHLESAFGCETLFLHGGTPKAKRDDMVAHFQSESGPPLFILSLKAGGTGLNLTRANHVFHFDRWWNPAAEDQATDRAFRIGQTRNVQVHKFVCTGTFEEKIDEMIESKRGVAETIVGAGESWITELDDAQLRELFALRPGAVED